VDARFIARKKAPGMGAVMRWPCAVGLPWRRGDQQEATPATLAGQERAAAAFERTARPAPVFGTPSARTLRRPKRLVLAKPPNPSGGAP